MCAVLLSWGPSTANNVLVINNVLVNGSPIPIEYILGSNQNIVTYTSTYTWMSEAFYMLENILIII